MKRETLAARKKFALTVTQRDAARKNARLARLKAPSAEPVPAAKLTGAGSGLAIWRKRTAEEKLERMEELERLREHATVELRDGREFILVRIPDSYDTAWRRKAS